MPPPPSSFVVVSSSKDSTSSIAGVSETALSALKSEVRSLQHDSTRVSQRHKQHTRYFNISQYEQRITMTKIFHLALAGLSMWCAFGIWTNGGARTLLVKQEGFGSTFSSKKTSSSEGSDVVGSLLKTSTVNNNNESSLVVHKKTSSSSNPMPEVQQPTVPAANEAVSAAANANSDQAAGRHPQQTPTSTRRYRYMHVPATAEGDSSYTPRTVHNIGLYPDTSSCSKYDGQSTNTSLVLSATLNRAWIIQEHCRRWKGPIIAVIAVSPPTATNTTTGGSEVDELTSNRIEAAVASWVGGCPQLDLSFYELDPVETQPGMYPVNKLRNIALDFVQTSHSLLIDIDFIPSYRLDETIRSAIHERRQQRSMFNSSAAETLAPEEEEAIVVPAFERFLDNKNPLGEQCKTAAACQEALLEENSTFIPKTFEELHDCVDRKDCRVFQDMRWFPSHSSTPYEQWFKGNGYELAGTERKMISVKCLKHRDWEPYLVVRWCGGSSLSSASYSSSLGSRPLPPYYDERFHGYGSNKIQWVYHLEEMGYHFPVLPGGFLVHNPHPLSSSFHIQNVTGKVMGQLFKNDVIPKLQELYSNKTAGVPFCPETWKEMWERMQKPLPKREVTAGDT